MPAPVPFITGKGPALSKIVIVTEAATADDIWKSQPLAGKTGDLFAKFLHEAGIIRAECYITSVLKTRAKDDSCETLYTQTKSTAGKLGLSTAWHDTWVAAEVPALSASLIAEILPHSPSVIIALGDFAMFALTGVYGSVDTWRGSHLELLDHPSITVIPTYRPQSVIARWETKSFCVRDLQRVRDISLHPEYYVRPTYSFTIAPTFDQVKSTLLSLLSLPLSGQRLILSTDIETIARHISCIGLAWSAREALCIPFMMLDGHYWPEDQELEIQFLLKSLLTHELVEVLGQNFNYDNQHFAKHLGYLPHQTDDTMIAQHVLFPGIPKSLDFLSSMYCHWHRYWKDEMDDYSRLPENMEQYWTYNCKDVVVTFEVMSVLNNLLDHLTRRPQYEFMLETARSALRSMLRGIRIDIEARSAVAGRLMEVISEYESLIHQIVGFPLNVGSPAQMSKYFYGDLGLPVQFNRKTKRPTLDDKALKALCKKEPLIIPLVELIEKKRSCGVFLSTFCLMPLDTDKRMRCSFNVCGTETMRFSSSSNAFGSGGNLQNIPKGEE